jgi:peptidyl-prolyl cis-trans isomerase SurA
MRLITTLSLGVAALALAGVPLHAQNAVPAVGGATAAGTTPSGAAVPFAPAPQATPATAPPAPAPTAPAATAAATKPAAPAATSNGIVAVVNDQSISDYELEQRIAFAVAVYGSKPTEEELKRIRAQTLQRMENEKVQIAEARRLKITVSPVEINEQIDAFLKDQGASKEELSKVLAAAGTSLDTFRNQQTAFLAWQKVIREVYASDILITPPMVDDAMRRAVEGANKPQYRVSEIFLAVDRPEDNDKVKAEMEEIEKQIRAGAGFRNLARQYSRNPSAALGGDMGIVYDGQLDPELNAVVASLKKGELSRPVRAKGGWYLLGVQDRIEPLGTNVVEEPPPPSGPPGTLPLARLSLGLPPDPNQQAVDNAMKMAMQIRAVADREATDREVTDPCVTLEKLSHVEILKGSVFENRGNQLLAELHPELQKVLAQTKSGEVAMPVLLASGVEIFARCDKRAPPPRTVFKMPTRDDIEQRLFQEQISALARRYLRDLKRDASIVERGKDNPIVDAALVK